MTKFDDFPKAFFLTLVVPFWCLIKNPFGSRAMGWALFIPHCIISFSFGQSVCHLADTYGVAGARAQGVVAGRKMSGSTRHGRYELKILLFGKEEWVPVSPVEHAYETGTPVFVDYTPGRFSGAAYVNAVDKTEIR